MKLKQLTSKFNDCGCVIIADKEKSILELNRIEVINFFEKYGVVLFKGFRNLKNELINFTNNYSISYANDAQRRERKMNSDKLHGVDEGKMEMPMHSEASYSPSWPEIVWFYCELAPKKSGKTTICDGKEIFKRLSLKSKNFFMKNQILYNLKIPFNNKSAANKLKDSVDRPWFIESQGIYDTKINFSTNQVSMKQKNMQFNLQD